MNPVMFGTLKDNEKFRLIQTDMLWIKAIPESSKLEGNNHNAYCRIDGVITGNFFPADTLVLKEESNATD